VFLGNVDACSTTLAPLLSQLGSASDPTIQTYGWIDALTQLANKQPLNTTGWTEDPDNFFEASLMTPTDAPMSDAAMRSFASYLVRADLSRLR